MMPTWSNVTSREKLYLLYFKFSFYSFLRFIRHSSLSLCVIHFFLPLFSPSLFLLACKFIILINDFKKTGLFYHPSIQACFSKDFFNKGIDRNRKKQNYVHMQYKKNRTFSQWNSVSNRNESTNICCDFSFVNSGKFIEIDRTVVVHLDDDQYSVHVVSRTLESLKTV